MRGRRRSVGQVFAWPLFLALAGLTGLVLGLTGDGWRDAMAVLLLGLPLIAIAVGWHRRS
jgi:hypothetical protein